jgi:hypothetical protein
MMLVCLGGFFDDKDGGEKQKDVKGGVVGSTSAPICCKNSEIN